VYLQQNRNSQLPPTKTELMKHICSIYSQYIFTKCRNIF
jgi:hypothetical protein